MPAGIIKYFHKEPARLEVFKQHPHSHVRRFALPYPNARSESKFYFEQWQLKKPSLPDYIEEMCPPPDPPGTSGGCSAA